MRRFSAFFLSSCLAALFFTCANGPFAFSVQPDKKPADWIIGTWEWQPETPVKSEEFKICTKFSADNKMSTFAISKGKDDPTIKVTAAISEASYRVEGDGNELRLHTIAKGKEATDKIMQLDANLLKIADMKTGQVLTLKRVNLNLK